MQPISRQSRKFNMAEEETSGSEETTVF